MRADMSDCTHGGGQQALPEFRPGQVLHEKKCAQTGVRHHCDRHGFCLQVNKKVSAEKLPSTAFYSDIQEGGVGEAPTHRVIRDIEYKSAATDEVVDLEDRTKAYRVRTQSLPACLDAAPPGCPLVNRENRREADRVQSGSRSSCADAGGIDCLVA